MLDKQLLTTKDIENLFGVTKHTTMIWRNNGTLPYTKLMVENFFIKKKNI